MPHYKSNKPRVTSINQPLHFDVTPFMKFVITSDMMNEFTQSNQAERDFVRGKKEYKKTPPIPEDHQPCQNETPIFVPKQRDNLFWCFYIMKHGLDAFILMPHKNMVTEKRLKIEYIERLRDNKSFIKTNKLGPLSHIENFLLNEIAIDMKTFHALCLFEGLSCIITFPSFYYEIKLDTDDNEGDVETNVHVLTKIKDTNNFGYKNGATQSEVSLVRSQHYKVENLSKPIKAMTSYKMDELLTIANKLDILLPDKVKKKDVYQFIVQALS